MLLSPPTSSVLQARSKPQEALCLKGIKTPIRRVSVLHTGEELKVTYTGSLPWSGIPGTAWIWAKNMALHSYATVLKVELEGEIMYNLGHGEGWMMSEA